MPFGPAKKCSIMKWPVHRNRSGHRPKGGICDRGHKHCLLCAPPERGFFGVLDRARSGS